MWRLDVLFSNYKERDLEIINDGGWHFTNIKTPEKLYEKLKNFGHHDEFDESGIDLNFIKSKINNKEVFYDHFLDKKDPNKWRSNYKLKKVSFKGLLKSSNFTESELYTNCDVNKDLSSFK